MSFRRVFPDRGRQLLDGGKNSKFERSIIENNESPDCANVVLTDGGPETRQGVTKLNTAPIGTFVGDGLYTRRDDTGAETMVAFVGGTMWQLGGTSFTTIASAQSVFTAGMRVATAQYENRMFIGNGGVIPYKYDGTNFTRHGVYPPATTSTVASNGVGNLDASADYRYKMTFVNSALVESDVGPVTATFTISSTSGQNRLTSLPIAPQSWGVSTRNLYRTEGGGTTFKRLATIADNTTTTYDDNIADASLGVTAPTDNGVPPKYSTIVYHQNRLFMNDPENPNYVWYTNLAEPYTVASTNFIRVGDGTSDLVRGLAVFDNSVVAYCDNSVWVIYMEDTTPGNWRILRAKSSYGSKSPFGMFDYNGKQMFPAVQNGKFVGFAALSGLSLEATNSQLQESTPGSDLKSDRVETDMFDIVETYTGNISSFVFKNAAWVSVTYGSGATQNNRIYHVDFSMANLRKNQELTWVPFTGLKPAQFTIYGGNLYFISAEATGYIYKCESGVYSDDGAAIDSYIWTKEFGGLPGDQNTHKDFRYVNMLIDNAGDYFMNAAYRVDSDRGTGTNKQIDLDPGGSLWGTMVWGRDSWGGGTDQREYRLFLDNARGKRIQLKFSNQNVAGQRFKVSGLNLFYNLKGDR